MNRKEVKIKVWAWTFRIGWGPSLRRTNGRGLRDPRTWKEVGLRPLLGTGKASCLVARSFISLSTHLFLRLGLKVAQAGFEFTR